MIQIQETILKGSTLKKESKNKLIASTLKKCEGCGTPYRLKPEVYKVNGKVRDHSYWIPGCNCVEIIAEREKKKKLGEMIARRIRRLLDCDIDPVYKNKTFSNFDKSENPDAYAKCRKFAKHFGEGLKKVSLFLTGYVGTGKTHLAVAIADYVARLKYRKIRSFILFASVPDLVDKIREKRSLTPMRDNLYQCDLLILDDLGSEHITEWSTKIMQNIIDIRYRSKKPTVITTNLDLEDVNKIYGEMVFSRIYEMCCGVEFRGEDYRLKMTYETKKKTMKM